MTRRDLIRRALVLAPVRLRAFNPLSIFHEDHLLATESACGFRASLGSVLGDVRRNASIYAGLRHLPDAQNCDLLRRVHSGQWILIENGALFATDQELRLHRHWMYDLFGVRVGKPVQSEMATDLYIHYRWPLNSSFRHFSQYTPVITNEKEIIARVGVTPVALRKPIGRGGIIYLGSPLGPILTGRDPEAQEIVLALADQLGYSLVAGLA